MTEFVDPFELVAAPEPTGEQLAPEEGEWYRPYPERPVLRVLPEARWPRGLPEGHRLRWPARFYVESASGRVGLVPWPGSQVVWPSEAGWLPDVHAVVADSKPERESRGKR